MTGAPPWSGFPAPLHRAVLRVLRPAESALRRLIVIAAQGLEVKIAPSRPKPTGAIKRKGGKRQPSFPLFDPRKRFGARRRRKTGPRAVPRIHYFDSDGRLVTP
jgi:hypothetical protein